MTLANSLSVDDLTIELEIGRATVNFILERFSPLLNSECSNENHQYSPSVIPLLIRIRDFMSSGMLPSQIEDIIKKELSAPSLEALSQGDPCPDSGRDIRMNQEALAFIREMVSDIRGHQGRIARAHEKRAEAEERKADAIEKRAEAENKKADAMNNIAMALQEMNQLRSLDSHSMKVAGQAVRALTMDETNRPSNYPDDPDSALWGSNHLDGSSLDENDWEGDFEDPLAGMSDLLNHPEPAPQSIDTGDLDGLTQDSEDLAVQANAPGLSERDLDNLSALIDTVSDSGTEIENLDGLIQEQIPLPEPDDLFLLVDDASDSVNMDDLYSLVDDVPENTDMDNLSLLVDPSPSAGPEKIDDLSALIESQPAENAGQRIPMDDLSLLVDTPLESEDANDDLWSLVDRAADKDENTTIDDLSALIDPAPAEPSLKPDITPDQDLGRYKAAVMKIIIELKSRGLNPKETTDRLNRDEVPTLSGKPFWAENAIAKIYGFIDTAK